jgi:hypothetical protein
MPPHRGAEAEQTECNQQRAICQDQPVRHVLQSPGADAAGERQQSGAHPRRIGTFRRQDVAIGSEPVVRSALSSIRAEECSSSRALSPTLRVCCSTDLAVCFTAAPADF